MRIEPENLTDVELLGYLKPGESHKTRVCVVERALLVELIKRYQRLSEDHAEMLEEVRKETYREKNNILISASISFQ